MRNKLVISAFALFLAVSAWAQQPVSTGVITAENKLVSQGMELSNRIEIYPNPATDYIVVEINNSTLQHAKIEMHSIIGNEVKIEIEDIGDGKYRIPIKNFATGYYFLVVKDDVARFKKAYRFLKR